MGRFTGVLGLLTMLGLAYLFSTNRKAIKLKIVLWGLGLQISLAFLVIRWTAGQRLFLRMGNAVTKVLSYAFVGSEFVFGELGKQNSSIGFIFAFQVLPTIIFIASLFALLYYLGVMQVIIRGVAWAMQRVMGASGAESLNVAASIFMGQTEAPLTIRPFIPDLTQSEIMTIMTSGMAHVSGGIMAAYIAFGVEARHLLTAVIMTAPGTLLISKMLVPETEQPKTMGVVHMEHVERDQNFIGALSRGTSEGLGMAINVGAMLIAFLAVIALANGILNGIHNWLRLSLVSDQPPADFRLGLCSCGLGDWSPVAGLQADREPARHSHGPQRTRGVFHARADEGRARSAVLYNRYVCAVRIREFQFDWNADWRHWRAGAQSEIATR